MLSPIVTRCHFPLSFLIYYIPSFKSSLLELSFTFKLSSTSVVPSGASSFTIAFPSTSPVFSTVIVYLMFSPAFTVSLSAFFVNVITGFFVSSVSFPSTVALFFIVPFASSFTVTTKLTSVFPFAGTPISIPSFKFSAVSFTQFPFIFILPSTNVVPSGISSFTIVFPLVLPALLTVIVYSKSSPAATAVLFDGFSG